MKIDMDPMELSTLVDRLWEQYRAAAGEAVVLFCAAQALAGPQREEVRDLARDRLDNAASVYRLWDRLSQL